MVKQPYTRQNSLEFDEELFIKHAEEAQTELLSGANQYLFDLDEYLKSLRGTMANSIEISAGSLGSAIRCTTGGLVKDTRLYLNDAKRYNRDIPEEIISSIMKAARLGGLRNLVKNLRVINS